MGIKKPICQNIKQIYIQQKIYINKHVFVFIVILNSLIMYVSLEASQGVDQA